MPDAGSVTTDQASSPFEVHGSFLTSPVCWTMNRCPVYLWKNCPGVIGSYCIECAGSCALIHMMTCVSNADLWNSHNRQKAAESLMASEKHFLASSHTKKNCRPPSVVLVAERLTATYLLLAYILEFKLISGTKHKIYTLPFNLGRIVSPSSWGSCGHSQRVNCFNVQYVFCQQVMLSILLQFYN